ncbi:uncharacterized protein G2W53_031959 [Senna tora]|uniref:Uncharacterized protein n=1 Tax=Senna tora TaxID=362788 RepID=A0A834SUX9_9FABA|nr:uncharacterized protein G2W53_031959 [Senna tora]
MGGENDYIRGGMSGLNRWCLVEPPANRSGVGEVLEMREPEATPLCVGPTGVG